MGPTVTGDFDEPVDREALHGPARPETLSVEFYENDHGVLVRKNRGGGPSIFLLLWLIGWSVGCVFLAAELVNNPNISALLFAIPFWASWFFVAGLLAWMFFGKETLLLRPDAAMFQRSALVKLSSRVIPSTEIREFRECRSKHQENDQYLWGIELVTAGKPLRFDFRLPDRERAWLIYRLNQYLSATGAGEVTSMTTRSLSAAAPLESLAQTTESPFCQTLLRDQTLPAPPSDCQFTFTDNVTSFEFAVRGKFPLGLVAVLGFLNAFWNGIVLIFVFNLIRGEVGKNNMKIPQGWERIGMGVFLIPFVVIGLGMFVGLLFALFEPLRRSLLRFEQDRIVSETIWPVYRHTHQWPIADVDRLELRREGAEDHGSRKRLGQSLKEVLGDSPHSLAFVSASNVDLCVLDGFTEGEARWFAHEIFARRPHWFRGVA